MSLINVAFDGEKIFEWQGNADTLAQIDQEATRMAKLAHTSPQALWQSTLVGIKQNGGRYFTPNPKAEMLVVTWGLMALPTHHPDHPGVFGDYLDGLWDFDFNIKIDPEDDKKFTVEVTGGFELDEQHEAKVAIETFREVLNRKQEPKARTHQSDLKISGLDPDGANDNPNEPLTKIDGSQEKQAPSRTGFDSYRSLADPNIRIVVAKDAVPPFRFKAGGWELTQSSIEVGSATKARIAAKGFFMFRVNEDQTGGTELTDFPSRLQGGT
jgi:hypothetical protein